MFSKTIKTICDIGDAVFKKSTESDTVNIEHTPLSQNNAFAKLWYEGAEKDWQKALDAYYDFLRPEQIDIENYIENIDVEMVKNLDANGFYDFLHDKYFVWKYTAKNRLATTTMNLEKYIINDELHILKDIQTRIFDAPKSDVGECLKIACEIRGLGTAGASGLLAILFPKDFGTVDKFVVKRLQEINHPLYADDLNCMNPDNLKIKDGIILVNIMKEKAAELNQKFNTDFWTPRKIDMIMWAYGR